MRCFLFLSFLLLSAPMALARCDAGEVVIRFSHVNRSVDHPIGDAASLLEKRINTEMDGLACMEVYANSTLYTDDRVMGALINGDIQMAAPSFGKVDSYTKALRVFSMPFVFKNLEAVEAFQDSLTGELMKNSMIGKGIRGMGFWHNGMTQFSANRPLLFPSDAVDLKIRTSGSEISNALMTSLGAISTQIDFAETYSALTSGEIDGTEDSWANLQSKEFYRVQEGITETNHSVRGSLVIVSNAWWKSLSGEVASLLGKILAEVTLEQKKDVFEQNENARQAILDAGGTVRPVSEERRLEWASAFRPVWEQFSKDVHPRLINYIDEVNKRF